MHVESTVDVNSRDVQLSFLNAIINVFNKTFLFSCFPCFQTAAQIRQVLMKRAHKLHFQSGSIQNILHDQKCDEP